VATALYAGVWVYAILFPGGADSDANGERIIIGGLFYLLLLLMIGTPVLADRLNEFRWATTVSAETQRGSKASIRVEPLVR
jgi:hypothetical protein